jgi:hypothetical protein
MSDILLTHELLIRWAAFGCIFTAMAAWEIVAPRREQTLGRMMRWPGNIGIVILDTVLTGKSGSPAPAWVKKSAPMSVLRATIIAPTRFVLSKRATILMSG